MAYVPAFTAQRSTTLTDLLLEDTSTGSDPAITTRYVYLIKSDGTFLVPVGTLTDYIEWPLADGVNLTIADIFVLQGTLLDYALDIKVEWRDNASALYTLILLVDAPQVSQQFAYYLIQLQAGNPKVVDRSDWYLNLVKYYCYIKNSITAVEGGSDISSAQYNLNLARNMSSQPNVFFL